MTITSANERFLPTFAPPLPESFTSQLTSLILLQQSQRWAQNFGRSEIERRRETRWRTSPTRRAHSAVWSEQDWNGRKNSGSVFFKAKPLVPLKLGDALKQCSRMLEVMEQVRLTRACSSLSAVMYHLSTKSTSQTGIFPCRVAFISLSARHPWVSWGGASSPGGARVISWGESLGLLGGHVSSWGHPWVSWGVAGGSRTWQHWSSASSYQTR